MSLVYLFLKATKLIDYPCDYFFCFALIDLDIIALFSVLRWWKVWKEGGKMS